MKFFYQTTKFTLIFALTLYNAVSYSGQVIALPKESAISSTVQFKMPPPPEGDAPSGRYSGGASRGLCPDVKIPLTALVPFTETASPQDTTEKIVNVWGLTTAETPTWWFYVPYDNPASYKAEFALQENDEDVYRSAIALPTKPGVFSVRPPSKLAAGKNYRWFFKIYCDQNSSPMYVEGVIRRVSLNPQQQRQLTTANPRQQVALYAANGIWFNALDTLAQARRTKPQDAALAKDWQSLLQSVGLEKIANAPLVK